MADWKEVYGSTHIDKVMYDPDTKRLSIRFLDGDVYTYLEVPPEVYREFESSISKGRFVNVVLRRGYSYVREASTPS